MEPKNKSRKDLKKDNVSVVHSGEIDPAPNEEAQEAYAEEDLPERIEPEDKREAA